MMIMIVPLMTCTHMLEPGKVPLSHRKEAICTKAKTVHAPQSIQPCNKKNSIYIVKIIINILA